MHLRSRGLTFFYFVLRGYSFLHPNGVGSHKVKRIPEGARGETVETELRFDAILQHKGNVYYYFFSPFWADERRQGKG